MLDEPGPQLGRGQVVDRTLGPGLSDEPVEDHPIPGDALRRQALGGLGRAEEISCVAETEGRRHHLIWVRRSPRSQTQAGDGSDGRDSHELEFGARPDPRSESGAHAERRVELCAREVVE